MIPKKLHIIWIGDAARTPHNHIQTWVARHPQWSVTVWDNDRFASRKWRLSQQMAQLAVIDIRAIVEMMRLEILHDEGGVAVDADSFCVTPVADEMLTCEAFGCWSDEVYQPGVLSTWFMGLAPHHPTIDSVINEIESDRQLAVKPIDFSVGAMRYSQAWRQRSFAGINIHPSYYFLSAQRAAAGEGAGKTVIALHERATSRGIAQTLHQRASPLPAICAALTPAQGVGQVRFTIGIVTYNRADWLRGAVDSALRQTCRDFELLIVDDGSTDSTPEYLHRLSDPRVRWLHQANAGEAAARNQLLRQARGAFVVWLDSDDELLPQTLERYRLIVESQPGVDVIYGDLIRMDHSGATDGGFRYCSGDKVGFPILFRHNQLPNPGTAVRRAQALAIGGYDTSLPSSPDYDLWTRLAAADARFCHAGIAVCRYRWHGENLSGNQDKIRDADGRIAEKLANHVPWPRLFPNLDWSGKPEESNLRAAMEVARVLVDRGRPAAAAGVLQAARAAGRHGVQGSFCAA
jgi:hypothetical protein